MKPITVDGIAYKRTEDFFKVPEKTKYQFFKGMHSINGKDMATEEATFFLGIWKQLERLAVENNPDYKGDLVEFWLSKFEEWLTYSVCFELALNEFSEFFFPDAGVIDVHWTSHWEQIFDQQYLPKWNKKMEFTAKNMACSYIWQIQKEILVRSGAKTFLELEVPEINKSPDPSINLDFTIDPWSNWNSWDYIQYYDDEGKEVDYVTSHYKYIHNDNIDNNGYTITELDVEDYPEIMDGIFCDVCDDHKPFEFDEETFLYYCRHCGTINVCFFCQEVSLCDGLMGFWICPDCDEHTVSEVNTDQKLLAGS